MHQGELRKLVTMMMMMIMMILINMMVMMVMMMMISQSINQSIVYLLTDRLMSQ